MSDSMKQAWNEVADGFTTLGKLMKERYQTSHLGDGAESTADPIDDPELRAAFDRFVAAGRELTDRVADVATDAEVKSQAKHAAASFEGALTVTVDLIAQQVNALVGRFRSSGPETTEPDDDTTSS